MFYSIMEIKKATRGTACYDDESTSLLREAAVDTFKTEGC